MKYGFFFFTLLLLHSFTSAASAQTCVQADLSHPNTASLVWQDNSTDETGFVLERKLNGGAYSVLATLGVNIVSFTDATVVRGPTAPNTYTYRIKAVKTGAGDSAYSAEACITFAPIPPPPANSPTNLIVK